MIFDWFRRQFRGGELTDGESTDAAGASTPHWGKPFYPRPGRAGLAYTEYCAFVYKRFRRFTLEGLASTQDPVDLREVYVPLGLAETPIEDNADEEAVAEDAHDVLWWLERHPCVVVSGQPGSGKTTLVRHLVSEMCARVTNPATRALPDHLPIPLLLRDYPVATLSSLQDIIDLWLAEVRAETDLDMDGLQPFIDQGRWLILLDGIDELGTRERRQQVWDWLSDHQRAHLGRGLYLVTSRPSGLSDLDLKSPFPLKFWVAGLEPYVPPLVHIRPLTRASISQFCERWFDLPGYRRQDSERKADLLRDTLEQRDDLRELARRPAFLTMMAFVHATIGELPDSRAELYERLVEAYLHVLDRTRQLEHKQPTERPRWPQSDTKRILTQLGFLAQIGVDRQGGQDEDDERDRRFVWTRPELCQELERIIRTSGPFKVARPEHAEALVDYFLERTGLLTEPREGVVQFGHLSFQEYLAAVYLQVRASAARDKTAFVRKFVFPRLERPGWDEVITLFMAIDARHTQGRGHRAVLLGLSMTSERQVRWLVRLLGGREIALTASDRKIWLAGILAAALACGWADLGEPLARLPENGEPLADWFVAAFVPWNERPHKRLRAALEPLVVSASPDDGNPLGDDLLLLAAEDSRSAADDDPAAFLLSCGTFWADDSTGHRQPDDLLAIAGVVLGDAGGVVPDGSLARAIPPRLCVPRPDASPSYLETRESLWSLLGLCRSDTRDFINNLRARLHLGACITLDEDTFVPWQWLAPTDNEQRLRQVLQTSLLLMSHHPAAAENADAWRQSLYLSQSQSLYLSLYLSLSRYLSRYLSLSLSRSRSRSLSLSRSLSRSRSRSRSLSRSRSRSLYLYLYLYQSQSQSLYLYQSLYLSRSLSRSLSLSRSQSLSQSIDRASSLSISLQQRILTLAARFGHLSEAIHLPPDPRTEDPGPQAGGPLTRDRLQHALHTFRHPDWLTEDDPTDPQRRAREFRECQQIGLFPTAILQAALDDPDYLTRPVTTDDIHARLEQELAAWNADADAEEAARADADPDAPSSRSTPEDL